jgi:hypothetical protein
MWSSNLVPSVFVAQYASLKQRIGEPVAAGWLKAFLGAQHLVGADEFFNSQDFWISSSNLAMLKG